MTDKPTKAAHTAGPVDIVETKPGHFIVKTDGTTFICQLYTKYQRLLRGDGPENPQADAALIAEAFNVATETGMTPRQIAYQLEMANKLLETANNAIRAANKKNDGLKVRRAELLALLDEAATAIEEEVSAGDDDHPIIRAHRETAEKVRAAIAKAGAA